MIQMVSDRDGTAIYSKYPEMRAWIGQQCLNSVCVTWNIGAEEVNIR